MLTDKQEIFCKEYIVDFNATQAAIRAGYSKKTARSVGSENLTKPDIQNKIKELIEDRNDRVQIDSDYVLRQAVKLHERCMQEVKPKMIAGIVLKDADNNSIYEFNASGAAKSLELIGKHVNVKAWEEKIDVTSNGKGIQPTKIEVIVVRNKKDIDDARKDADNAIG